MALKITQADRILCYLNQYDKPLPVFKIMDWGLRHYIVDAKRLLPKMAETGLVKGEYKGKYKVWVITPRGREEILTICRKIYKEPITKDCIDALQNFVEVESRIDPRGIKLGGSI